MHRSILVGLAAALVLATAATGWTEDAKDNPAADKAPEIKENPKLAARRLDLMRERIAAVKVSSSEEDFPDHFATEPIFRYTDPARSYVAAALWKLGEKGRPKAIIATELRRQFFGSPRIVYEYLSLTPTQFSAAGGDVAWAPDKSALEFQPVPSAPAPAETPEKRLLQLRTIARRFAGHEMIGKERCELRLMPQPIDRYTPSREERADGALFLFTFGTNPEVAMFLESDGKTWNYAAGRLSGATKIELTIDEKTAWQAARLQHGANSAYTATNAPADIPGVAADGSEIEE